MASTLGLVIPAYQPDIEQLSAYVADIIGEFEPETIRVEVDAAEEQTVTELADLPADISAVPYRRGKGAAITAGFEALETDVLTFADADGATPATELARVVDAVQTRGSDLAVGSRRHPQSTVATHQTFARRRLGDTFAWLARRLLAVDLYDYQCGAKALTAESWEEIRGHLYEPGFAWDIELIAMAGALGHRVEEVPIEWHDRPNSTVSPVRDSFRLARALFGARHRAKQVSDNPLHTAIAQRRNQPTALVDDE
ncbi:glycosyltransferase [Halovenus salina]|uniref:Glycosyltransferase n=1 Tax=Halovenus salina TaxID=1510225 RepID=A0ABD5W139_9EURY|nr:glycosyltransferase [Halovenus salina]